jgi:NAD(P)-dependent dehydrogenase (short-subunit alcohol dehydrogenase family)
MFCGDAMNVHLFVPVALTRAVLPIMRSQSSGTIVQMSSQGAGEVAPFGIRVMIVEPSRFRTSFHHDVQETAVHGAYRDVLAAIRADLAGADGVQEGDPVRAAALIVDLVRGDRVPLRLPLGAEAVQRIGASYRSNLEALEQWADLARSADFAGTVPAQRPI